MIVNLLFLSFRVIDMEFILSLTHTPTFSKGRVEECKFLQIQNRFYLNKGFASLQFFDGMWNLCMTIENSHEQWPYFENFLSTTRD